MYTLFSDRLFKELEITKWTQSQLANLLGTSQQTISRWVKGINQPTFDDLLKLCVLFNVDTNYLLGYDELDIEYIEQEFDKKGFDNALKSNYLTIEEQEKNTNKK